MEDLIDYLNIMRENLEGNPDINLIMEEISNIATNNWVETGKPNLNKEQLDKVILRVISKKIILN